MKLHIRKILGLCGVATIAVIFSMCYAEQGTVINEVTGKPIVGSLVWRESGWHTPITYEVPGKPIAGAQIVVYWTGRVAMPVQSSEACIRLITTMSDENGKFEIPAFSGNFNPLLERRMRQVYVVAQGYRETRNTNSDKLLYSMRPLADPKIDPEKADEDRKYMHDHNPDGSCEDPKKLVLPYLKVRYQNLEQLANSYADREALIGYLAHVDRIEFGARIADQNYAVRILEFGKLKQDKGGQK